MFNFLIYISIRISIRILLQDATVALMQMSRAGSKREPEGQVCKYFLFIELNI